MMSMDQPRYDISHDSGIHEIFQDFEQSKLDLIRTQLASGNPFLIWAYVTISFFWTILMSWGAGVHGANLYAPNMAPHVSQFILIIGVLLFPRDRIAIPVAIYTVAYLVPFYFPFVPGRSWATLAAMSPWFILLTFVLQLSSGLVIAGVTRLVAEGLKKKFSNYMVDVVTAATVFVLFLVVTALQNMISWQMAMQLGLKSMQQLGYNADFFHLAGLRVLQGGVVVAAFFLTMLEAPNLKQSLSGLAFALCFPVLAYAQAFGLGMDPSLDAALLGLVLVLVLPVRVATACMMIGFPLYVSVTGQFLIHHHHTSLQTGWFETYANVTLTFIVLILALRSLHQHTQGDRLASMRRMSMMRNLADVGLVCFNLTSDKFRADHAGQRILGVGQTGELIDFINQFEGADREDIAKALSDENQRVINLQIHRKGKSSQETRQVLRIFLWYETSAIGNPIAYGLVLDITAEREQERALKATLAELSSKQEQQRQLFSIVSHELRTPASVVSMLIDELDDAAKAPRIHKQLREATDQLLTTLADMRQTVNPTKNLPVKRVNYRPYDLAEAIHSMFEHQAKAKGTTIQLLMGADAHHVRNGDMVRIKQAISNLVRNAIIHSRGTEIVINFSSKKSATTRETLSVWSISDNGIGIAEEEVDRLFEPFERGSKDARNQADGSGLGLFIVKSSIEALEGNVSFFRPEAGGAGYLIEVPEPVNTKLNNELSKQHATPKESEKFPHLRIILAEDNQLVADVTQARLLNFVGKVEVAQNGREALDQIIANPPDMVITDLFMPEMDGDELIRTLRARGYTKPIIGLTAAVVGDEMEQLRQAGADHAMSKPIDFRALLAIITEMHLPA